MAGTERWVIGIDEVGRGALAGPVVVAAALLPIPFQALKDSKKLSPTQREQWVKYFKTYPEIKIATARVYPRGIERLNISGAANRAAEKALAQLTKISSVKGAGITTPVFLDGGLFLGNKVRQQTLKNVKTVIKGDEKISAVAAASIVAKVTRDRFMVKLAKRYPGYGFEIHKGYGTRAHRAAIKKKGPCEAHRLTFLGKKPNIRG